MAEVYDLTTMLEQIVEDEKASTPMNREVSQAEIKQMLFDRQRPETLDKTGSNIPLEEALLQNGLISREQLQQACRVQSEKGGKIGSILLDLGYISDEALLEFLETQHGIRSTSLLNLDISDDTIRILPTKIILKHRVLPLSVSSRTLSLAMETPNDLAAIQEVEFLTGKTVKPYIIPSYQMRLTMNCVEEQGGEIVCAAEIQRALNGAVTMQTLFHYLTLSRGTNVLVAAGTPPSVKLNNVLRRSKMQPFTISQCETCARVLMTNQQWQEFQKRDEIDFSIDYDNKERFRVTAYKQKNSISMVIRLISDKVLSFEALGLPDWLKAFLQKPYGLILVTAPSGQGKTTTLAAMVDYINRNRKCNVVTLEDPIEYLHRCLASNINQREIGTDIDSFSSGLDRIQRLSPDVIAISEIRDRATLEGAINSALTGHLVLSSMLSTNATDAIENMIDLLPENQQSRGRQQLAEVLLLVFSQKLVPRTDSDSLLLVYEKLLNSHRIRSFIREGKIQQVRSQIQEESDDFDSLDSCLARLVEQRRISMEDALVFADDPYFLLKC